MQSKSSSTHQLTNGSAPTIGGTVGYPSSRAYWWLAAIIALHLLLGTLFAVVVPPLENLDEYIHWNYIRYLIDYHKLPDHREVYIRENPGEFHQPPLYYVIGALFTSPIPSSTPRLSYEPVNHFGGAFLLTAIPDNANLVLHNPQQEAFPWQGDALALHILRWYSLALSAASLIPMFWLAWVTFHDEALALGATAWLALRPSVLSVGATISNDSLILLTGTGVLAMMAYIVAHGPTWRRSVALGALLGISALSKYTLPASIVAVPIAFALSPGSRKDWPRRLAQLAVAGLIALAIAGWWFARNLFLYSDWTGVGISNAPYSPSFLPFRGNLPSWAETLHVGWLSFRRYWAHFGFIGMPDWGNIGLAGLSVLLVAGLVRWFWAARVRQVTPYPRVVLWAMLVAVLYLAQLSLMHATVIHGGQSRFMTPGFGSMAVLHQLGLVGLLGAKHKKLAGALPVLVLVPLTLYAVFGVLSPAYDLPNRVPDPADLAARYDYPTDVRFDDAIRLIGFRISPQTVRPGEPVFVTLCWVSRGPLDEAIPYAVHIVDEHDGKIGERNTHPGLGMYPTTIWEPDIAFCDEVRVPLSADAPAPQAYRVILSYFHEETLETLPAALPDGTVQDFVALGEVAVIPRRWPSVPEARYVFGDTIALGSYGLAHQEEALHIWLTWHASQAINEDYTVFVHILDTYSNLVAQADVRPRNGTFPTLYWPAGAVVSDEIVIPLDNVPPGHYYVWVGLYDSATLERLQVVTADGQLIPNGAVRLGEFTH